MKKDASQVVVLLLQHKAGRYCEMYSVLGGLGHVVFSFILCFSSSFLFVTGFLCDFPAILGKSCVCDEMDRGVC